MRSVTSEFKSAIRNNAVYSDGYVIIKDGASFNRTYNSDELNLIEIMNDIFKNDTYVGEIGQSALKLNLLGDNTSLLPLDKQLTIEVYLGVLVGSSYEYVKYQDFILLEAKYNETTTQTEILATDKLVLLNQDFTDNNTYPMTLGNYVESVVVACGLQLENKTWLNNDFSLTSQPFPDVYNAREIIEKAAELAMSFVVINPNTNKVDFRNFYTKLTTNAFDEEIDENEYFKLKTRDNNLGKNGVNTLVLRLSQVEGENNTVVNATNVGIDGNIEVVISDNDFINSETKRLSIINTMFTRIDGLKYQPLDLEYRGFPYLELGDVIKVKSPTNHRKLELYSHLSLEDFTHLQLEGRDFYVPVLETMVRYNGGLFGTIKAEPLINTETKYRNTNPLQNRVRNAEIKVDKVNGEISAIVSDVNDLEGQVSSNTAQLVIQADQIQLGVKSSSNTRDSVVPYNQFDWEQGSINPNTGVSFPESTFLRTIGFHSVKPSTRYVLECSNTLGLTTTIIFWYNGTTFLSVSDFNPNGKIVTSPANATNCRVRIQKSGGGTFLLSEMPNHFVRVSPNSTLQELSSQLTIRDDAIALKANQTTVDTVSAVANSKARTFLSTPTTPYYVGDIWIETDATTGGNRVCTTQRLTGPYVAGDWTKEGVTSRIDSAELKITPTAITSTVRSSTEYTNDLGAKENTVFKQNTAPAHVNGRLWLDTSVTPNVLNRSNGTAWVRATPTQASEVGAYSSGQVDTLLTSYSTITQTANDITLAVSTSSNGTDSVVPYDISRWEQGGYSGANGLPLTTTTDIRTKTTINIPILPNTDYILSCSSSLSYANTGIVVFNSSNVFLGYFAITNGERRITTPATASYFRARATKSDLTTFTVDQMPNHFVRVTQVGKFLKGARYTFNDTNFAITNNANTTVFTADVNGNLDIIGKITADSGAIGGFSIGADTLSAGTTNATAVGMGSARSDNIAFYAGHLTPTSAPFRVTRAGAMTALSGSVGGWSISSDRIQRGNVTLFASGTNGSININGIGLSSSVANQLLITGSGTVDVSPTLQTNNIFPSSTNTWSLGNGSFRWASIWQQSGAVVGSDLRLKDKIEEILQAKDFVMNLKPVQYVLKEGQSGRKHYGFIAQEVKQAMEKVGIDDFGGYIDPTITEKDLDENGQMLALRYEEFIAPMVATIQSQQKKIDELEERLANLEQLLNV